VPAGLNVSFHQHSHAPAKHVVNRNVKELPGMVNNFWKDYFWPCLN
jgi:hypothetical protein